MRLVRIPFPLGLALGALFLAVLAQYIYTVQHKSEASFLFFGVAIVLWWGSLLLSPTQVAMTDTLIVPTNPRTVSRWLASSGIGLAVLAYSFAGENQFTSDGVLAWVTGVGVLLYTFWEPVKTWDDWRVWFASLSDQVRKVFSDGVRIPPRIILLALVLFVGAFFYFYKLDTIPAEMVSDHAEKVLDIREIVNGARPVYLLRNSGSEPLWSYGVAVLVGLGDRPLNFVMLKFASALFGWLFIPALYLLARELFDDDVALIAAAFAAIAQWMLGLGRSGLPFATTPLLVTLLLWFLLRAIKYQRRNDFLVTGILLGIGFYANEPFLVAPILVVIFLVTALILMPAVRRNWRIYLQNSFLLFVVAVAVLAPLVRFVDDSIEVFFYHTTTRMAGNAPFLFGNAFPVFTQNLANALVMFNAGGDGSWLVGTPNAPALDYVTGGLFILGIAFALYRLVKSREMIFVFLFLGLVVWLIPSAISLVNPLDNPSLVYAAGTLPIVLIFPALAVAWGARVVSVSLPPRWRGWVLGALIVVLFGLSARANYENYFNAFDALYRKATWNASEIATIARGFTESIGDSTHVWLIGFPYWVDARLVGIELEQDRWSQVLANADQALAQQNEPLPKLYIFNISDRASLTRLREIFPNGQERVYRSLVPSHDLFLFYVLGVSTP